VTVPRTRRTASPSSGRSARTVVRGAAASLALALGAAGVLVVAPAGPTAYAETAVGGPLTSTVDTAVAVPDPDEALAQATDALQGPTSTPPGPGTPDTDTDTLSERVDASLALRDLAAARPSMTGADADRADALLARPGDGASDPYGDGYSVRSSKICSGHFCVHRVDSTADRATLAFARTTLSTMERVYALEVGRLGYRKPVADGSRGGDKKFDVYLKELGRQNLYGYCAPERTDAGRPGRAASAFCVLDNDFARSQYGRAPSESLRVTAGHEFFHAVQFGYDRLEDRWLLESTATWMEERFADDVDDNRQYLRSGQVAKPARSLDVNQAFDFYGNWAFWEALSQRYGLSIVREVIQRATKPGVYSAVALRQALARRGGLPQVFASYAAGNNVPGRSYDEGGQAGWPTAEVSATRTVSRGTDQVSWAGTVDHLASRNLKVVSKGVPEGRRIRVSVDGPGSATAPAAALVLVRKSGSVLRRPIPLDADGKGSVTVGFASKGQSRAFVTVANASTRFDCDRGTSFSCEGEALDQGQRFVVKVDQLR